MCMQGVPLLPTSPAPPAAPPATAQDPAAVPTAPRTAGRPIPSTHLPVGPGAPLLDDISGTVTPVPRHVAQLQAEPRSAQSTGGLSYSPGLRCVAMTVSLTAPPSFAPPQGSVHRVLVRY